VTSNEKAPKRAMWIGVLLLSLVVVIPQILVPLSLPAETIQAPIASSLDEPATWPYAFGALVCHQRPDRSFALAGNQLPVCDRCFAIELGMVAAFGAAVAVRPQGGFFLSLGMFLPRRCRSPIIVLAVGLAFMLPMVLDGGLQFISGYISAAPQRLATGFLYGIGQAGIVIGLVAIILQQVQPRCDENDDK